MFKATKERKKSKKKKPVENESIRRIVKEEKIVKLKLPSVRFPQRYYEETQK